jgi:hypothetical protein
MTDSSVAEFTPPKRGSFRMTICFFWDSLMQGKPFPRRAWEREPFDSSLGILEVAQDSNLVSGATFRRKFKLHCVLLKVAGKNEMAGLLEMMCQGMDPDTFVLMSFPRKAREREEGDFK